MHSSNGPDLKKEHDVQKGFLTRAFVQLKFEMHVFRAASDILHQDMPKSSIQPSLSHKATMKCPGSRNHLVCFIDSPPQKLPRFRQDFRDFNFEEATFEQLQENLVHPDTRRLAHLRIVSTYIVVLCIDIRLLCLLRADMSRYGRTFVTAFSSPNLALALHRALGTMGQDMTDQ